MALTHPCLLREESFGGTLFNPNNGKRTYLDRTEFESVRRSMDLKGLETLVHSDSSMVAIRRPARLHDVSFSAPDRVFFELTRGCNLRCTHCFNASGVAQADELPPEAIKVIIAELSEFGAQEIRFTGGEPMASPPLADYISEASTRHLRTSIGTNATLATAHHAQRLADAGLNEAIVSIDGLETRHNRIRGEGSFKRTINGMHAFVRYGIKVRINMVVMHDNLTDVLGVVGLAESEGLSITLRRFIASGRAEGSTDSGISWQEYAELRERLRRWLNAPDSFVDGHYLKNEEIKLRISLPFRRSACSAGQRGMVILPDGKIQSCGFLAPLGEPTAGRLPNLSVADAWNQLVTSRYLAERRAAVNQTSPSRSIGNECLALIETGQDH